MAEGYMQEIRKRVLTAEDGTLFIASDFADIADTGTVRSALYRLVQNGNLRRILNGIFEKPKFSRLLNEYVAADPDAVAKALARSALRKYCVEHVGIVHTGHGGVVLHQ